MGCHYATRIPRYGRDLAYIKPLAHAIIPAEGNEVFRLDLEAGRFLKPFELGGFDGVGGTVKAGECVAVAEGSHSLMAIGTDAGTTEFWDPRSRTRVGILAPPPNGGSVIDTLGEANTPSITCAQFHQNGLGFATGNAAGIVTLYDLRSPTPILRKDQGYGFPIHTLKFMQTASTADPKVLSSDKKVIKLWDQHTGAHWASMQPTVDINHVCPIPNSGMIFTANEGQQMWTYLIPKLGPSPKWCSHLDGQIEELANRTVNDPDAYNSATAEAATYDNYKFLTKTEMRQLSLDHLLTSGTGAKVVRPYMHGYFVPQGLYDEARLIADPFEWDRQRQRLVNNKIEKERESRIRSTAKDKAAEKVKINKRLAERLEWQTQKLTKAASKRPKDDADSESDEGGEPVPTAETAAKPADVFTDPRFAGLFSKPEFTVDENSHEFRLLNPSTKPVSFSTDADGNISRRRGKTAVEALEDASDANSSDDDSGDESEPTAPAQSRPKKSEPEMRISSSSYRKAGHDTRGYGDRNSKPKPKREKTFGSRKMGLSHGDRVRKEMLEEMGSRKGGRGAMGDKEVTFKVAPKRRERPEQEEKRDMGSRGRAFKERRSASGNVFRREGLGK